MYYKCSYCGANLDPQEHCECQKLAQEKQLKREKLFCTGEGGQMQMEVKKYVYNI